MAMARGGMIQAVQCFLQPKQAASKMKGFRNRTQFDLAFCEPLVSEKLFPYKITLSAALITDPIRNAHALLRTPLSLRYADSQMHVRWERSAMPAFVTFSVPTGLCMSMYGSATCRTSFIRPTHARHTARGRSTAVTRRGHDGMQVRALVAEGGAPAVKLVACDMVRTHTLPHHCTAGLARRGHSTKSDFWIGCMDCAAGRDTTDDG